jgi:formyltetrahydrofolate-dependent phosphoribosylglycinamide formyltransferase
VSARVAVLASGGGTNLQAILDHFSARGAWASGRVVLVVGDRAQAGALRRARDAGIAARHIPGDALESDLAGALGSAQIDIVALAGFLRLVPAAVTRAFHGRIVNVHPALLPAFGGPGMYGVRVHQAVIAAGARVTGVTVHFVNEHFDRGAIIAQWPVPVRSDDTPETLAARVLRTEHAIYPSVIDALCAGTIRLGDDNRIVGRDEPAPDAQFRLIT